MKFMELVDLVLAESRAVSVEGVSDVSVQQATHILTLFFERRYKLQGRVGDVFTRFRFILTDKRFDYDGHRYVFEVLPREHDSKEPLSYRTPAGAMKDHPEPRPGYVYRGMSFEEWQNIKRTGQIQSNGSYNLGAPQEGMTLFSTRSDTAFFYAGSFQPLPTTATRSRPGVVIEIPDTHTPMKADDKEYKGLTGNERAFRGAVPSSAVTRAWYVVPYLSRAGMVEVIYGKDVNGVEHVGEGSRHTPSVYCCFVPVSL